MFDNVNQNTNITATIPATLDIRPKGSLDEQVRFFNQLRRDFPEIVSPLIAASLSAPLLAALGLDGFTFNIVGNAGTGKTALLELLASIWKDPAIAVHNGFMTDCA